MTRYRSAVRGVTDPIHAAIQDMGVVAAKAERADTAATIENPSWLLSHRRDMAVFSGDAWSIHGGRFGRCSQATSEASRWRDELSSSPPLSACPLPTTGQFDMIAATAAVWQCPRSLGSLGGKKVHKTVKF